MELPRRLVAQEIVDGGFVFSNKLFNIHNIFHASAAAQKLLINLPPFAKNRLEKSPSQLPLPTTKLDAAGQPLTNPELINQAFQEVLKNPKYRKFNSQTRQKLHNLALLETMENFCARRAFRLPTKLISKMLFAKSAIPLVVLLAGRKNAKKIIIVINSAGFRAQFNATPYLWRA